MKTYTFRVIQPLVGYYEGEVSINAESEDKAMTLLKEMNSEEFGNLCKNWEQGDEMSPHGDIDIQELISES